MEYRLGIDFGTSTTKVALRRETGIPERIPIGLAGDDFMPSAVAYRRIANDKTAVMAVGEAALTVHDTANTKVVKDIKRCLFITEHLHKKRFQKDYAWWDTESGMVQLWSDRLSPEDVILTIITEALDRAATKARQLGVAPEIDNFTIRGLPTRLGTSVTASLQTRKILAEVARRVGIPKFVAKDLWEEPILACLPYVHHQLTPGEIVLVYDLGGGTFDTAVIRVEHGGSRDIPYLTVLSFDGESFCGGVDIDDALFEHLAARIARECLDSGTEEAQMVLDIMNADERQYLKDQARDAKERLSTAHETTLVLPPGFLGKSAAILKLTRKEIEAIIEKTRLVDKTKECVCRAWRRARMLIRKRDEAIGGFYLQCDSSSGAIGGSVLGLGHDDLRKMVDRVLIVGGTTRIPYIRETLESLWGQNKVISGGVVEPITACSVGAAWGQESVGKIVDRLPFSIIVKWDSGQQTLYQAYDETVKYMTRTSPSVIPFKSEPLTLPDGCAPICVEYQNPEGEPELATELKSRPANPCHLEIDMFGQITLKTARGLSQIELDNKYQHNLQKDLAAQLKAEKQRQKKEEIERAGRYISKRPGEDHDVG